MEERQQHEQQQRHEQHEQEQEDKEEKDEEQQQEQAPASFGDGGDGSSSTNTPEEAEEQTGKVEDEKRDKMTKQKESGEGGNGHELDGIVDEGEDENEDVDEESRYDGKAGESRGRKNSVSSARRYSSSSSSSSTLATNFSEASSGPTTPRQIPLPESPQPSSPSPPPLSPPPLSPPPPTPPASSSPVHRSPAANVGHNNKTVNIADNKRLVADTDNSHNANANNVGSSSTSAAPPSSKPATSSSSSSSNGGGGSSVPTTQPSVEKKGSDANTTSKADSEGSTGSSASPKCRTFRVPQGGVDRRWFDNFVTKQMAAIAELTHTAVTTTRETRASYLPRLPPGMREEDQEERKLDRLQAEADALLRKRAKPVNICPLGAAADTWSTTGAGVGAADDNSDGNLDKKRSRPQHSRPRPRPRPLTVPGKGPNDNDGSKAGVGASRAASVVLDDQQLDSDQHTTKKGEHEGKDGQSINDRIQANDTDDYDNAVAADDADENSNKPNSAVATTIRAKLDCAGAALHASRSLDALWFALHALSLARAGDKAEDKQWRLPQQEQEQKWAQEQKERREQEQEQQLDALAAACYFWKGAGEARLGLHDDALDSFRRAGMCRGRHIEGEWLDSEIDAAIDALSEARLVSPGF